MSAQVAAETAPPTSPASGRLARSQDEATNRQETDEFGKTLYRDSDRGIVDVVAQIAEDRGVARAQVALAWLLQKKGLTAPIVGASKPRHLTDSVATLAL